MHFVFLHVRILARGIKNKYLSRFLTFPIKEALRQAICLASLFVRLFLCCREMCCLLLMIPNAQALYDHNRVETVPVLSGEGCVTTCDPSDGNSCAPAKGAINLNENVTTQCWIHSGLSWQQPSCIKPTLSS